MKRRWQYDDGGREAAGFRGSTGDCVVRAIAIALEQPYAEVYENINELARTTERGKNAGRSSARSGVWRNTYDLYLKANGWHFVPCVKIGTGCKIHLRADELPKGRIITRLSKHLSAVVDGIVRDTFDPSRAGTRCVYGFYAKGLHLWQMPNTLIAALYELDAPMMERLEEEQVQ